MTKSIMVPVDLAHTDGLEQAIAEAGRLAKSSRAALTLVGVAGSGPTEAAHTPEEYKTKLAAYGAKVAARIDHPAATLSMVDNDVTADLGPVLVQAAQDHGIDLIVMASHIPGFREHIIASHAGYVASHAKCSVYVAR